MRVRRLIPLVTLVAAAALPGSAAPAKAAMRDRCDRPGTSTVVRTDQLRMYVRGTVAWACSRATGRRRALGVPARERTGEEAGRVIAAQVASGPWLVYVIVDHGIGTTTTRPIAAPRLLAFDARTLRVRHVTREIGCLRRGSDPASDPSAVAIRDVVVDRSGAAAWTCTGPDALAAAEVHAADAEGPATIGLLGDASPQAPLITRRGAVVSWGPGGTQARRLRHVPRAAADRPCTFPVGSVEVGRSGAATLATATVRGEPGSGRYEVLWSCPARARRPLVLFSGGDTDPSQSTTLTGVRLAGTRAIAVVDSASYEDGSIALRVFGVATGHAYDALTFDRQSGHRIDDYALGAGGEVLWLTSSQYEVTEHLVLATHAGGIREIAVAPAGQITGLALTASAATWTQDGVPRAVALR